MNLGSRCTFLGLLERSCRKLFGVPLTSVIPGGGPKKLLAERAGEKEATTKLAAKNAAFIQRDMTSVSVRVTDR